MYPIPGHIALSLTGSYLLRLPYAPAVAATLFVDVIDKGLKDILDITPYGRCWMHTGLALLILTAIVTYWKGKEWGLSWFIGHFLHLVGDIGFVPWLYPFRSYHWPDAPNVLLASAQGLQETLSGLNPIRESAGGFHYSQAVANVFKMKLIVLEFLILLPIGGAIALHQESHRRWRNGLVAAALVAALARLAYEFPLLIHHLSRVAGDWVRIDS